MYKWKNKWNGKLYTVVKKKQKEVTLERDDGSQFTIKAELLFNCYTNNFEKVTKNS